MFPTGGAPRIHPVTEGDRFRHPTATGDRLLEVHGVFFGGGNTARVTCLPVDETTGFVDTTPADDDYVDFTIRGDDDCQAALRLRSDSWKQIERDSEAFFGSLEPGTVLHRLIGPGRYLRGAVVLDDGPCGDPGRKLVLPTALVGHGWAQTEIASFDAAGEVVIGAWARHVVDEVTSEVAAKEIFGSPVYRRRPDEFDPSMLPARSLIPPALPAGEQQARRLLAQVAAQATDAKTTGLERLAAVKALIADAEL